MTPYTCFCACCGIEFCFSTDRETRLRASGDDFFCPSGHVNRFTPSENSTLKRRIAELEDELKRMTGYRDNAVERAAGNYRTFRCAFEGCGYGSESRKRVQNHMVKMHDVRIGAHRRALPANAGPSS